jgi:hypothetical protein
MRLCKTPHAWSPPTHTLLFYPVACSALADCQMGLKYDPSLMRCALRVATCHRWVGWAGGRLCGWVGTGGWSGGGLQASWTELHGAGVGQIQLAILTDSLLIQVAVYIGYAACCSRMGDFDEAVMPAVLSRVCLNKLHHFPLPCFCCLVCCSRMGDFDEAFKVLAGLRDQAGGAR